ncbi:hypothetical protein MSAN_01662500 [Mycena sanguinolenta]|uniref:Uncharacterized protein n=1 Tax=Mycena sanguinolenta TaxID=230812 RepID=A0A8H6XZ48_9AGAR|nr:hypothetical protein MSAN_01662500 [Mycena sanguinolenta]
MASDSQIAKLLAQPASFTPNFTVEHSVVLAHSLETVFDKLGSGETLEESVRLSDLCSTFHLTKLDHIVLSKDQSLAKERCRGLPPTPSTSDFKPSSNDGQRTLPRQFFVLQEVVPLLCGLYQHTVTIAGCLTSDREGKAALYETSAAGGILVRKFRTFEELAPSEGGQARTKVHERIEGRAPMLLRSTVEKETREGSYFSYGAVPYAFHLIRLVPEHLKEG